MKTFSCIITITDGEENLSMDFVVEAEGIEKVAEIISADLDIDF